MTYELCCTCCWNVLGTADDSEVESVREWARSALERDQGWEPIVYQTDDDGSESGDALREWINA